MRIGQTSFIVFASKLLGSVFGFLATLVFARVVGAEILGIYVLAITVLGWLALPGKFGISSAAKKRISEDREPGQYLATTLVWMFGLGFIVSLAVIVSRSALDSYILGSDEYLPITIIWVLILLLFINYIYKIVLTVLRAERKVHIAAILNTVKDVCRSVIQIGLVLSGFSLLGMLVGYALGGIFVGIVGLYWVSVRPQRPERRHFRSLFDYAKFSWLGSLRTKIFNDIDILVLGLFVPSALIGIYAVTWSLSKFLEIFSNAIASTMFPEISHTSVAETKHATATLVEDSLRYNGLVIIPGLVGGVILAEEILRIYGPEFVEGETVLGLLICAVLLYTYQKQFLNALNGVDRPDLAFRVNFVFAVLNVGLNIVLIWEYGIEGAALASLLSVSVALVLAYRYLDQLVEFRIPSGEIGRQVVASLVMGPIVYLSLTLFQTTGLVQHAVILVALLVPTGAVIYFTTLFGISSEFRATIDRNLPVTIPYFTNSR